MYLSHSPEEDRMISTSCLSFLLLLAGVGAECPPSWTNGGGDSCYLVSRTPMNWFSAQQFCWDNGGYLAEILSAEEEARIDSFLPSDLDYWIGLSDSKMFSFVRTFREKFRSLIKTRPLLDNSI